MYGIKPLPSGTQIKPWLPDLIQVPLSRALERLGVYFYNRVIHPTEIGLRQKAYNPRIHGPYCHYRWYGKQDTKLLDVKVSDLPAWFGRREKTIGAFYNEFVRNVARMHYYYMGSVYGSPVRAIFRFMYAICFFMWCFKFYLTWDFRHALYHW